MTVVYQKIDEYENKVVGDVEYNQRLDYLVDSNFRNGGVGRHLGFDQIPDGRFCLIFGTQWQNEQNTAFIASKRKVIKEAIKSGNISELDDYPELVEIYQSEFSQDQPQKSRVFSIRVKLTETKTDFAVKLAKMTAKIEKYLLIDNAQDPDDLEYLHEKNVI